MSKEKEAIIRRFSTYVQQYKAEVWEALNMVTVLDKREGIYFWDITGKRFINCHCNGGVFNLGHSNPEVKQALIDGMEKYDVGNHHLVSKPRSELAEQLVDSFGYDSDGQRMNKVIFGASGGEAVDLAIKMARGYTRKETIISVNGGYHGHTGFAVGTTKQNLKDNFNLKTPGFLQIEIEDLNRIEDYIDEHTAALILETSPATMGFYIIPHETMQHLRTICTQKNIVFIIDEVQTGMGRTGEVWGFQKYDIMPDMMVAAKGLSGGLYPMSVTAFKAKYDKVFENSAFGHVSTMGGSELGCLATSKALEIVTRDGFLEHVNIMADYFQKEMKELVDSPTNSIVHLRQLGMAMGVVFQNKAIALAMMAKCYENGIYCFFSSYDLRVIQFKPPLIITMEQAMEVMILFRKSLSELDEDYVINVATRFATLRV